MMIFIWMIGFLFSLGLCLDRLQYNRDGAVDVSLLAAFWPVILGNQIRKKAGWRDDN